MNKTKDTPRKTLSQSKNKVVMMMNLFEKHIDEKIRIIDIETGMIQGGKNLYRVDIVKNKVENISCESLQHIVNEPFD